MPGGLLVIISGPSGVGKTTVTHRLVERGGLHRVVTATTRAPRPGERDGKDYHFLTREAFRTGIERGQFLEHAKVHDHLYGTPRQAVEAGLAAGETLLLNVDVQGGRQIRTTAADLPHVSIFLLPPDLDELERRLRGRDTETTEQVERRLKTARQELEEQTAYDHRIVNSSLEETVDAILALVRSAGGARGS